MIVKFLKLCRAVHANSSERFDQICAKDPKLAVVVTDSK